MAVPNERLPELRVISGGRTTVKVPREGLEALVLEVDSMNRDALLICDAVLPRLRRAWMTAQAIGSVPIEQLVAGAIDSMERFERRHVPKGIA
jgi:hypothetical protein